jgi:SAM-dependent methyltransferase
MRTATEPTGQATPPWQLRMFSKALKKQQKLRLLLDQAENIVDLDCLLVTNGDNNGALNHHFRAAGGRWTWVENEDDHIAEMEALLGDSVLLGEPSHIPAADEAFDLVISIDVHEHLDDCTPFNKELFRVVRPGGRVIVTTPNGDAWKPVTVFKQWIGMTKEAYGHKVIGYNVEQLTEMLETVGLEARASGSYSHFFTEFVELVINFAYVKILSRKKGAPEIAEGVIAPSSNDQLKSVEREYRLYAAAYPILRAIAALDWPISFLTGYAVSVVARKGS